MLKQNIFFNCATFFFFTTETLRMHLAIHLKLNPYICEICGKVFFLAYNQSQVSKFKNMASTRSKLKHFKRVICMEALKCLPVCAMAGGDLKNINMYHVFAVFFFMLKNSL